jgi:KaiC/GvpD/RAD55 family RecA-like ATPase
MGTLTESFIKTMQRGRAGQDKSILLPFPQLPLFVKSNYWVVTGMPGTGKTSFVDETFVIDLAETGYNIKWIYHSLERNRQFKAARWLSNILAKKEGLYWSIHSLFQNKKKQFDMNDDQEALVSHYADYIETKIGNNMKFFEQTYNYNKIKANIMSTMATPEFKKADFVIHICDHIGKVDGRVNQLETIAAYSNMIANMRERYSLTAIDIMQINTRKLMDTQRRKNFGAEMTTADTFGSSVPEQNCDVFIGLQHPHKLGILRHRGYDLNAMSIDQFCPYRELIMLKGNFEPSLSTDILFDGEVGNFTIAPPYKDIDYEDIKSKYFRQLNGD